jgi:hypothetical protein
MLLNQQLVYRRQLSQMTGNRCNELSRPPISQWALELNNCHYNCTGTVLSDIRHVG